MGQNPNFYQKFVLEASLIERSNAERCASVSNCIDWNIRTEEGTFDGKGFLVGTLQCVKKGSMVQHVYIDGLYEWK